MKTGFFFFFILLFLFKIDQSEAQDVKKEQSNLNFTNFSLVYNKKFIPFSSSILDNLKKDGNNFWGLNYSESYHFYNDLFIRTDMGLSLGNISGNVAFNILLLPAIQIGADKLISFAFGSGLSYLALNNQTNNLGGLGSMTFLKFEIKIIKDFSLGLGCQFENYSKINYNGIFLNFNYKLK